MRELESSPPKPPAECRGIGVDAIPLWKARHDGVAFARPSPVRCSRCARRRRCSSRDERPHEHALEWLRPRVSRGLRALTAPPRSANLGAYVMAGLIAAADTPL